MPYQTAHGPNKRQRLFAKYLATAGVSDAECYIKAGYEPANAAVNAGKAKKNPKVQRLLEKYTADDTHKVIASRLELMDMLTEMARPDALDVDVLGNAKPAANAVRIKAMEVLNKMRGHEIARTIISGPNGGPIQLETAAKQYTVEEIVGHLPKELVPAFFAALKTLPAKQTK